MKLPISSAPCKRSPVPIAAADPGRALLESLETGDFESAQHIVGQYGDSVSSGLRAAIDEQSRQFIFSSAISTLKHALTVARATRSHVAFRLSTLQRESAYQAHLRKQNGWFIDC